MNPRGRGPRTSRLAIQWRGSRSPITPVLVSLAFAVGAPSLPATAQGASPAVTVTIDAVGAGGLAGLAILAAAPTGGTSVQILVPGATSGTFAGVHAGTCDAIDPMLVALLGDVSTTAQTSTPNPFPGLADGRHVLALHEGLDLTHSVGCGAIPAIAAAAGIPPPEMDQGSDGVFALPSTGGTHAAPRTGFTIAWDTRWTPYPASSSPEFERFGLTNGVSGVLFTSAPRPASYDALACARQGPTTLANAQAQGQLRGLTQLVAGDGTAVAGGDARRAWQGQRYTGVGGEIDGADVADYVECRMTDAIVVLIRHRTPFADYDREALAREELLEGLTLP